MPAYTAKSKVEDLLPSSLPSAITDSDFTEWIADASAEVDGEVGRDFPLLESGQKFEDYPDTPLQIELCARWLAASFGYARIKEINRASSDLDSEAKYRRMAEGKLKRIREGEIDVFGGAGEELDADAPAGVVVTARTQIFTATELDKFS